MTDFSDPDFFTRWRHFPLDLAVTLILWSYYTVGFVLLFAPFYLLAYCFAKERRTAFQKLNHIFYKGFFALLRRLVPSCGWEIPGEVREVRSSVIVCNHRSYIDPILLISIYARHATIAKARLFRIPVFGAMLTLSGYIPSEAGGRFAEMMMDLMAGMEAFIVSGGNVFIFPEGTRTRDGRIGGLNKGAFKIARISKAPVTVLFIENSDKLFPPGKFLFNARCSSTITLTKVLEISPDYEAEDFSINHLMADVRGVLEKKNAENGF